jgi:hypothetical protein
MIMKKNTVFGSPQAFLGWLVIAAIFAAAYGHFLAKPHWF